VLVFFVIVSRIKAPMRLTMKLVFSVVLCVVSFLALSANLPAPESTQQEGSKQGLLSSSEISQLQEKATAGDIAAQTALGKAYQDGKGVPQNDALALQWYRKAADQGAAAAENNLGIMYWMGEGVSRDKEEAVRWYRKAAKKGNPEAMFNLGAAYYNGEGVADDPVFAYSWFLLAKEAGNPAAEDAVRRSASEPGFSTGASIFQIGQMYEKGDDLPQSYAEAIRWYRKAADQSAECALRLAVLLINGTGVKQDYGEAMRLCDTFAKKYNAEAQYCVGYLYQRGLGVTADSKQAAKWYADAAERGHAKAALTLSDMYLKEEGLAIDRPEAFYFLYLAYKEGVPGAKAQARSVRQEMTKDEVKRVEKILRQHFFDPQKVFAIVDDPTTPNPRQVLPPVTR
jgi:uncharacterized protein